MKAIIVAGQNCQDIELSYPLYRLQEEGYQVKVAAKDCEPFTGIHGMKFKPDMSLFFKDLREFPDILIIAGGVLFQERVRIDKNVIDYVIHYFANARGVLAPICSGSQTLISAGFLNGKTIGAYEAMEADVLNAGANYSKNPVTIDRTTETSIVSSPHYKHVGPWMKAVMQEADKQRNRRLGR